MVATVVNVTSASSGDRYFLVDGFGSVSEAPDEDGRPDGDAAGYYARAHHEHRKSSHWRGAGAAALRLRGHIASDAFRRVLEGYVPGTDLRLGPGCATARTSTAPGSTSRSRPRSRSRSKRCCRGGAMRARCAPTTRRCAQRSTSSRRGCSRPGGGILSALARCR